MQDHAEITVLLKAWRNGDDQALAAITPLVYGSLRKIAARLRFREPADLTLQATEIVHEAFMRLVDTSIDWQDRAHFYAIAARTMRRILVDHARSRKSDKRGGMFSKITLDENLAIENPAEDLLIDFDNALEKLHKLDPRKSDALSLYIFGGLTAKESAEVLNVSLATIERDLSFSKAWMNRELNTAKEKNND